MKWAAIVPPDKRRPVLNRRHNDYAFWPLTLIPRSWTAWISEVPPIQIAGTNPPDHNTDIAADGTWSLAWPFHFCITLKSGLFFHFGMRYDYNDFYYNIDINWPKKHI